MSLTRIKTNESAKSEPAAPQVDTSSVNASIGPFHPLPVDSSVDTAKVARGEERPHVGRAADGTPGVKYKKRNRQLTETITDAQSYLSNQEWKAFLESTDTDLDKTGKFALSELYGTDAVKVAKSRQSAAVDSLALTEALMDLDKVMIPILRLDATRPSIDARQKSHTVMSSGKGKGAVTLSPEEAKLFDLFRNLSSVPHALEYHYEFQACLSDLKSTGNSKLDELESHLQAVLRWTAKDRTAEAQYSLGDACQTVKSHWRQTIANRTSSKH